jgi:hypothetical protein
VGLKCADPPFSLIMFISRWQSVMRVISAIVTLRIDVMMRYAGAGASRCAGGTSAAS